MAIDRQVRACDPAPGTWSTFEGERIKVDTRSGDYIERVKA